MSFVFAWLFIYCEAAERVTNEFNIFHEKLCQSQWNQFSNQTQKIYLIALSGTQESVVMHGYANTTCTREAFKRVIFLKSLLLIRHFLYSNIFLLKIERFFCRLWRVDFRISQCFVESIHRPRNWWSMVGRVVSKLEKLISSSSIFIDRLMPFSV